MQDSPFTAPEAIRATYASKGRNRKLNIAKAESLGADHSQLQTISAGGMSPTTTNITVGSTAPVLDPTLYTQPDTSYETSTYDPADEQLRFFQIEQA